jgi:hypothetical protein
MHAVKTCRVFARDWEDRFWIRWLDLLQLMQSSGLKQYSAIADPHTLQFTVTQTLGIWVYIAVTWHLSLQITHEVFISQPNSFLAIILQLPILKTRLNSIPLLPDSYHGRLAFRNPTHFTERPQLHSSLQPLSTDHAKNTASLLLERRVYGAVA